MSDLIITIIAFVIIAFYMIFVWSLYVRRWHDLGRSGWMSLLQFVPILSIILLLYLFFAKGTEGSNIYGEPNVKKPFWRSIFFPSSLSSTDRSILPNGASQSPENSNIT